MSGPTRRALSGLLLALCASPACFVAYNDPLVFEEEVEPLREEWLDLCESECAEPDASTMCAPVPGDPISCGVFNPAKAEECIYAYRSAIRNGDCTPGKRSVQSLESSCPSVYSECGAADTGTGETGTTGDTTGMPDEDWPELVGGAQ